MPVQALLLTPLPPRNSFSINLDSCRCNNGCKAFPFPFKPNVPKASSRSVSNAMPARANNVEKEGKAESRGAGFAELKEKIMARGINCDSCLPGIFSHLICPKCKGGQAMERSLSFHITEKWDCAIWRCFRDECGWAGQILPDSRPAYTRVNQISEVKSSRQTAEERLNLEPLGHEMIAYFADRMISRETLQRNSVMQIAGSQKIIAFTYRQSGVLVGCKYRNIDKKFWQEKGTEKVFYGIDDIREADEIIIVEGEIDKLSMEEAGFCNCVSVPNGAPQAVSIKEMPSVDKDTRFQFLWNCRDTLDKASRIILATDNDIPGQALAEELVRRLGRERCWQVQWPKKDENSYFKDANEVLKHLGSSALREVVMHSEVYHTQNLN